MSHSRLVNLATVVILVLVPLAAICLWAPAAPVSGANVDGVGVRQVLEYRGQVSPDPAKPGETLLDNWQYTGVNTTLWR